MEQQNFKEQSTDEKKGFVDYIKMGLYVIAAIIFILFFIGKETCECSGDKCIITYSLMGKIKPLENVVNFEKELSRNEELFINHHTGKSGSYYELLWNDPNKSIQQVVFQKIHFASEEDASNFVNLFHSDKEFVVEN